MKDSQISWCRGIGIQDGARMAGVALLSPSASLPPPFSSPASLPPYLEQRGEREEEQLEEEQPRDVGRGLRGGLRGASLPPEEAGQHRNHHNLNDPVRGGGGVGLWGGGHPAATRTGRQAPKPPRSQ